MFAVNSETIRLNLMIHLIEEHGIIITGEPKMAELRQLHQNDHDGICDIPCAECAFDGNCQKQTNIKP